MLQKNSNLLVNICEVQLQSAWGNVFPAMAQIYTTLSRIRFSSDSSTGDGGLTYNNRLTCSYPGLSADQFADLDKFLRGLYHVRVATDEGERYEIAGEENPMKVETSFNDGRTEITFRHTAIEPVKYLGNTVEEEEPLGFPYNLTFNLG